MAKSPASLIVDSLQRSLGPVLKSAGFQKDARTYRRITTEGLVHVINIQMSLGGTGAAGRFAVNLGVLVPEVRAFQAGVAWAAKKAVIEHCCVSARLGAAHSGQSDFWWETDQPDVAANVISLLETEGIAWFDQYATYDSFVSRLSALHEDGGLPVGPSEAAIILSARGKPDAAAGWLAKGIAYAEREARPNLAAKYRRDAAALGLTSLLLP